MKRASTYWLADTDSKVVADTLCGMHGSWSIWETNPIVQAWVRNMISYYSNILEPDSWDSSLSYQGRQGELVKMCVPQARSLIRQLVSLITKQKMSYQAISESDSGDVAEETRLGNAVMEQVVDKEGCDAKGELIAESALVTGQGFIGALWRTDRGEPYAIDPESGNFLYQGNIDIVTPSVFDVFYDYTVPEWAKLDWVELRVTKNRWDLIAQFPHLKDKLLSIETVREGRGLFSWQDKITSQSDLIYCYELYVRPSSSLKNGRMMFYADPDTVFHDGINAYGTIPIEVMRPEPIMNLGLGYPHLSSLLPAQEMLDHSFSAVATNQSAFAVQSVTVPRGAGVSVQEIAGMNFVSFTPMSNVQGGGRPEALQLSQSSPETFKFIDLLKSHMLELSNLNSALRGSPPPGVTSGTAIATLTTNALEFIGTAQKSYTQTWERVMMHVLNGYKKFAKVERPVTMYGKNNQAFMKKFTGESLGSVAGVKISVANPLMQTMAGRLEMADKLAERGLVKSTQDYLLILEGAPTRKLYETELSESDLMQTENDALQTGQAVPVLITDDHAAHIRKHSMLLNDPMIRMNGKSNRVIMKHIEDHFNYAQNQDPLLAAMVRTGKMPEGMPPPDQGGALPPGQEGQEEGGPAVAPGPMPGSDQDQMRKITEEPAIDPAEPAEPADDLLGRGE